MASPLPASAARCNSPSLSSPSSRLRLSRLNIHIHDYALSPKSSPSEKNLQGGTQPSLLHSISAPDVESGLTGLPGLTADRGSSLYRGLQLMHSGQLTDPLLGECFGDYATTDNRSLISRRLAVLIRSRLTHQGKPVHSSRRATSGSMDAARNAGRAAAKMATINTATAAMESATVPCAVTP